MNRIIEYIKQVYHPSVIILYGSFANGTNGSESDFDALVLSTNHEIIHDTSYVNGTQLDVFVYPESYFENDYDCGDFIQIFDGKIILDTNQKGSALKQRVLTYLENRPQKEPDEIRKNMDWCFKMLKRSQRTDAEGMFRWHWLLTDSLEIFCDVMQHAYLGPKKSLIWMKEAYPEAFACYEKALSDFRRESLSDWIHCLNAAFETNFS